MKGVKKAETESSVGLAINSVLMLVLDKQSCQQFIAELSWVQLCCLPLLCLNLVVYTCIKILSLELGVIGGLLLRLTAV